MNDETQTSAHTEQAEPVVSPVPPLFYWAIFIPCFAVVTYGLQQLVAPRARAPQREPSDD